MGITEGTCSGPGEVLEAFLCPENPLGLMSFQYGGLVFTLVWAQGGIRDPGPWSLRGKPCNVSCLLQSWGLVQEGLTFSQDHARGPASCSLLGLHAQGSASPSEVGTMRGSQVSAGGSPGEPSPQWNGLPWPTPSLVEMIMLQAKKVENQ